MLVKVRPVIYIIVSIFFSLSIFSLTTENSWSAEKIKRKDDLASPIKLLRAVRLNSTEIIVDGKLDDLAWEKVPIANNFIQQEPNEGQAASEKTEVKVVYDIEAIYVAIYAYDSQPDKIRGLLTRRDEESPSDWLHVAIDSYADKRTAFEFAVNPAGVKLDALWSDDTNRDENWDAVWDVKTQVLLNGWTAEFRIPLSQLRFSHGSEKSWGFQIMRRINRNNEVDYWKHVPRNASGMVSLFGKLEGINNLSSHKHMQAMPYFLTSEETAPKEGGNPFKTGRDFDGRFGGDLKYGVTSNLTLDLTVNPDFGQVEADPSELNISAFETFFEEKRPFFIEGKNIFNYNVGIGDDNGLGSETLFYSRRIGRSPQFEPDISDDGFIEQPPQTSIIAAAKLTGKTANGFSIGILNAVTAEEKAKIDLFGTQHKESVEPTTNYFVSRFQKDFRNGRTTIGGIATHVYRNIKSEDLNFLNRRAYSGGMDVNHRWGEDRYSMQSSLLGSYVTGDKEAIQEVQTSSARYFQRPDAHHLSYDPERTSLSGFAAKIMTGKIAGGNWNYGFAGIIRSPGFEINDIGFQQNADLVLAALWGGYNQFEPGKLFRTYRLNYVTWHASNFANKRTTFGGNINGNFQFLNYWSVSGNINFETNQLATSLLRGGPAVKMPARYSFNFGFNSDQRKNVSGGLNGNYSIDTEGSYQLFFGPNVNIRPSGRFNLNLFFGLNPSVDQTQYVDEVNDNLGDHYVLSKLDRKTVFLIIRMNYTITPNLTVQLYAQPFFTAGKYTGFKEATDPLAENYDNRFQTYTYNDNPDFNFKQFRSNLVVRWEYNPGSTIFVVWSQGRTSFEEMGRFRFSRDFNRLFDQQSENIFLIKVNRWFSL